VHKQAGPILGPGLCLLSCASREHRPDQSPGLGGNWGFLAVALLANTLAGLARSRAVEANQRRQEADLAAERAQVLANNRPRCGGWRHWWRVGSPLLRCSPPWQASSPGACACKSGLISASEIASRYSGTRWRSRVTPEAELPYWSKYRATPSDDDRRVSVLGSSRRRWRATVSGRRRAALQRRARTRTRRSVSVSSRLETLLASGRSRFEVQGWRLLPAAEQRPARAPWHVLSGRATDKRGHR
jgi:hypothetical protein